MSFKALLSILKVAAIAQQGFAAPLDSNDISITRRDADVASNTTGPVLALHPVKAPASHLAPVDKQVVPQTSLDLHYAAGKNSSAALVNIPKLTHEVINAAGASAIKSVECSGATANVVFADHQGYDKAASTWSSAGEFFLVTYSESCGTGKDGKHDFLLVHGVSSKSDETLTISVTTEAVELENAVDQETTITIGVGATSDTTPVETRDIKKSGSKQLSWNKYPSNSKSPWGSAFKFFSNSKAEAYCVGCGSDGKVTLSANFELSLIKGLKKGTVAVDGNINAAAVFGLVGHGSIKVPVKDINLVTVPLEGIAIKDFLVLGPSLSLAVGGSLSVNAAGQLEAGAKLHWPKVHAELDVVNHKGSQSGWTPNVQPVFAASGTISTTLDVHLTETLAVGIEIKPIKLKKSVSISDQPGVEVTASYSNTGSCKKGVNVSARIFDNILADVLGKDFTLFTWKSNPISHCIKPKGKANFAVTSDEDSTEDSDADATATSSEVATATTTESDDEPTSTATGTEDNDDSDDDDDSTTASAPSSGFSTATPSAQPSSTISRPVSIMTPAARL